MYMLQVTLHGLNLSVSSFSAFVARVGNVTLVACLVLPLGLP